MQERESWPAGVTGRARELGNARLHASSGLSHPLYARTRRALCGANIYELTALGGIPFDTENPRACPDCRTLILERQAR